MTSRERRTRKQYERVQLGRTGRGYILTMIRFGFSDKRNRNRTLRRKRVPVKDDVVKYCGTSVRVRKEHNDCGLTCIWEFIRNSHENGPTRSERCVRKKRRSELSKDTRRLLHLFASLPSCGQYRKWFPPKIVSLHVPNVGSP